MNLLAIDTTSGVSKPVTLTGDLTIDSNGVVTLGVVPVAKGGTGLTSGYTIGDILYASAPGTLSKLSGVAGGSFLRSTGAGTAPVWSTLTFPNTATAGDILVAAADNIMATVSDANVGNVLLSGGPGIVPSYGKVTTAHTTGIAASGANADITRLSALAAGSAAVPSLLVDGVNSGFYSTVPGVISFSIGGLAAGSLSAAGLTVTALSLNTPLQPGSGGTGLASYTVGDLIYASGATAFSKLSDTVTGNALLSGGATTAPLWGKIGLTTHVSGTLPIANGGTNITSYVVGDLVYASGTTTLSKLADVAEGNVLLSGGLTTAPGYGKVTTSHTTGLAASGANADITSLSAISSTITPPATTGAQTINKSSGSVNFAAGAVTLVVTNSLVGTASRVFVTVATDDTTALIKNVVKASGSFTIKLNAAATAETRVDFFVLP